MIIFKIKFLFAHICLFLLGIIYLNSSNRNLLSLDIEIWIKRKKKSYKFNIVEGEDYILSSFWSKNKSQIYRKRLCF